MDEIALSEDNTGQERYTKKIFSDNILFIPEYIARAIDTSGITLTQYIDTVRAAIASPNFNDAWDLMDGTSGDLKVYIETIVGYNQMIYKTIGNEISNLLRIHIYTLQSLDIKYREDAFIEKILIKGLSRLDPSDLGNDFSAINLLKNRSNLAFNETYQIVNSDICLVILKDGFGNYLDDKECKKILLDDILNSRELFMGAEVFNSSFFQSSIKLNLSI